MSNYKTSLQTNNTSIQALISKAQALPLASGGTLVDNSYNENAIVGRTIRQYSNSRINTARQRAFAWCTKLRDVKIPNATSIGSMAFFQCDSLTSASFPSAEHIGTYAFESCHNLQNLDLPKAINIHPSAFHCCFQLSSLYLRQSAICQLTKSTAFDSTPYAGYSDYFSGMPHIYVRESLVDAYKSAANWSYFSSYFSGIPMVEFSIDGINFVAEQGMTWGEWVNSVYNTEPYDYQDTMFREKEDKHGLYWQDATNNDTIVYVSMTDIIEPEHYSYYELPRA